MITQWLLVLLTSTSFQTMGAFPEKSTCIDLQAQMALHFKKVQTACVSVTQAAPAVQAPKP